MASFHPSPDNKEILHELNQNIEKLNISTEKANRRMIVLTLVIAILTAVLVFQEFILRIIEIIF